MSRFDQPSLSPTKPADRKERSRIVAVAFERLEDQYFGARSILLRRLAKSSRPRNKQGRRHAGPGIDRARINLQRPLERPLGLLEVCLADRPEVPGPAAHDEVARIELDRSFSLDLLACSLDKLEAKRPRETRGDDALSLRTVYAHGLEPIGIDMSPASALDQLHISRT